MAATLKEDRNIPTTLEGLTALPGIGRKSANVILRETGMPAEGVMVDLHVLRVAPRLGIATGTDPKKMEKQMMEQVEQKDWGEVGMAISFLGRETCRPTNPKHSECVMNTVCAYYKELQNAPAGKKTPAAKKASPDKKASPSKKTSPAKKISAAKKASAAKKKR